MKVVLTLVWLIFFFSNLYGQEPYIYYYDKAGKECSKAEAYYYNTGLVNDTQNIGKFISYYVKTGLIKEEGNYNQNGMPDGVWQEYYLNGKIKRNQNYKDGNREGKYETWYENGDPWEERYYSNRPENVSEGKQIDYLLINYTDSVGDKLVDKGVGYFSFTKAKINDLDVYNYVQEDNYQRIEGRIVDGLREGKWNGISFNNLSFFEDYQNGTFLKGEIHKKDGTIVYYSQTYNNPKPKNGMEFFYRFIGANMKYPKDARKAGVQGRVFVQFDVDLNGNLIDIKVVKGIHKSCDLEAQKTIRKSPKWTPAHQRGIPVKVRMILPITFKLS